MGDRAYLRMTCRKQDEAVVDEALGGFSVYEDDPNASPSDLLEIEIQEANYGLYDERCELAARGIPFYGFHSEGGSYDACQFVANDGEMIEVAYLSCSGDIAVPVGEHGVPRGDEVLNVQKFLRLLKEVKFLFGEDTEEHTPEEQPSEACEACNGTGVLIDTLSGDCHVIPPFGYVVIERCSECDRFEDDLAAATTVADDARWTHCANDGLHAIGKPRTRKEPDESTRREQQ
jgi:hypothetical protein